jgi:hypothetical protein
MLKKIIFKKCLFKFAKFQLSGSAKIKHILQEKIPLKQKEAKELKEKYGNVVLTEATIDMVLYLLILKKGNDRNERYQITCH